MTDLQTAFNWLGGLATLAIGWFTTTLYGDVRGQQKELAQFKERVAEKYATNEDIKEIRDMFHSIMDKLERKADK